ncbi:G-type lectin S-receptor-like serine/threonine-protein kinase At1g11330 [Asparagus officinalis]|uniref:G-type lectin S-receptor-like serine/threonine-protein kinase At1g11330 n=1 Tax=Asparagus officinalis TaxID=4686 RepID=UPI00098E051E|nr:G-type lectin S-receptor-like serine/threonine-protein kinase At1g11330 [Asparagus officinalis]
MSSTSIISPILLIILYLPCLFIIAQATDTLTFGQSLTDGNSLVSAGKLFELGFFSPNSSTNRYIGIWYHDSPNNILWVANRETPVPDKSGSLKISSDGNLNLVDGMKIGIDLETNKNQLLDSWKSTSDPGVGKYSVAMDPDKSTQLFLWEGTQPRWRSGRWNGQIFTGIIYKVPFYIDGFQSIGFGIRTLKFWSASLGTKSEKSCAIGYNRCGKNAICADEEIPICKCLQGFMPKSTKEWRNSNWSGGCIRKTPLQCEGKDNSTGSLEERDRFLKLERVKVPDSSDWYEDVTDISGCEKTCRANCSCIAYSYVTGIGCLIWGVDLVDVHALYSAGNDLYLTLAEAKRNKDKLRVKEARSKLALPSCREQVANRIDWRLHYATNLCGIKNSALISQGYAQLEGVDYNEIFLPVVKHSSIRILLALVARLDLDLIQMDVKRAFLYGDLEVEIYITQPMEFVAAGKEDFVCKLKKSLYKLKQSPRQWYKRFDSFMIGQG